MPAVQQGHVCNHAKLLWGIFTGKLLDLFISSFHPFFTLFLPVADAPMILYKLLLAFPKQSSNIVWGERWYLYDKPY